MANIQLRAQTIKDLICHFDLKKGKKTEIQNSFNFNVRYTNNNNICVATLLHTAKDSENGTDFFLSAKLCGVFACTGVETPDDKKQVHVMAYNQLFPYLQSLVSYMTTNAGLPPMVLKQIDMKSADITMETNGEI